MAKVNISYFEKEFMDISDDIEQELESLKLPDFPVDFDKYKDCEIVKDRKNDIIKINKNLRVEVENMIAQWNKAENMNLALLGATLSLSEGTNFYENSAGGGDSGFVGNQYTSAKDKYVVNYIAIYSKGQFIGSIGLDDKITLEEKIEQLKKDGVIKKDSDIKISQHVAKKFEDGTLGDVGWLDQTSYKKPVVNKPKEEPEKFSPMWYEENIRPQIEDNEIITDKDGNRVKLKEILSASDGKNGKLDKILIQSGEKTKEIDVGLIHLGDDAIRSYLESMEKNGPVTVRLYYKHSDGISGKIYTYSKKETEFATTKAKIMGGAEEIIKNANINSNDNSKEEIIDSNGNKVDIADVFAETDENRGELASITVTAGGQSKKFSKGMKNSLSTNMIKNYIESFNSATEVNISCDYTHNHGRGAKSTKTYSRKGPDTTDATKVNLTDSNGEEMNIDDILAVKDGEDGELWDVTINVNGEETKFTKDILDDYVETDSIKKYLERLGNTHAVSVSCHYMYQNGKKGDKVKTYSNRKRSAWWHYFLILILQQIIISNLKSLEKR